MFTVAITGKSGAGKSTITQRILTRSLKDALPNCVRINGDEIKFETIGKVFADRPLIKRQWQNHELLGEDGRGSTMTMAVDNQSYRALMEIADPIIERKMVEIWKQAEQQGKDYCLIEYHGLKCLPKVINKADMLIEVMTETDKKRYQQLMGRHEVSEQLQDIQDPGKREKYALLMKLYNLETIEQLYELRDAAFEPDEKDAKKWRNYVLKKMDAGIFNHYDEARFDQWTEYLKYAITKEGTLHNAGKRPAQNWKMCKEDTWLRLNGTKFGNSTLEKCGEGIAQVGMKNIWMNEDPTAKERFVLLDEDYLTVEEVMRARNPKAKYWEGEADPADLEHVYDNYVFFPSTNAWLARTLADKLRQDAVKKIHDQKQGQFDFEK